jgi:hypothetical protein
MSKSLKKGSKAAKAWGAKMRRLRGGTKRRKSTRKGQRRKTARRAYEGLKRKTRNSYKRRKSSSGMKFPRILGGTGKKIAIGLGAAQLAGLALGFIAPQFAPIAKPVAALAAGGIPGVAAELVLDQGLLGNVMGIFNGGGINETRLASGL